MKNYEVLGFTSGQWEKAIWLSCWDDRVGGFWIYARRKDDYRKKLWVGIYDNDRKLAIIRSLDMSVAEWDKLGNDERKEMLKSLYDKFWEKYWNWEVINDDK